MSQPLTLRARLAANGVTPGRYRVRCLHCHINAVILSRQVRYGVA